MYLIYKSLSVIRGRSLEGNFQQLIYSGIAEGRQEDIGKLNKMLRRFTGKRRIRIVMRARVGCSRILFGQIEEVYRSISLYSILKYSGRDE